MGTQPIQFGDEGQVATRELLRRCDALAPLRLAGHTTFRGRLETLESIDKQYGGGGVLALEDVSDLIATLHTQLAHWEPESARRHLDAPAPTPAIPIAVVPPPIPHPPQLPPAHPPSTS